MARIFIDTLQPNDCDGIYTLQGYVSGVWTDIHTISGALSGSIEVDEIINTINLDTSVFVPGQSYLFKWVDTGGHESNVRVIYINEALLGEDGSFILNETAGLVLLEN